MNRVRVDGHFVAAEQDDDEDDAGPSAPYLVPIAWEALADAIENNRPGLRSYLHLESGQVIRLDEAIDDPDAHARVTSDRRWLRVSPVPAPEQFRWMERFITTVTEDELRARLLTAIRERGAFRRFKDALRTNTLEHDRWLAFRRSQVGEAMASWLARYGIEARSQFSSPRTIAVHRESGGPESAAMWTASRPRARLFRLVDGLAPQDLADAVAFLEFLHARSDSHTEHVRSGSHPEPLPGE